MVSIIRSTIVCALLFSYSAVIVADKVRLMNGDQLTGTIIQKTGGTLTLATDYAGQMEIRWDHIQNISTDGLAHIVLDDNTVRDGLISAGQGTQIEIRFDSDTRTESIAMDRVQAINPTYEPKYRMKGHANLGFNQRRGNTDTDFYHVDAESTLRSKENRYWLGGKLDIKKDSGIKSEERAALLGKYDRFLNERWYLYTSLNLDHDKFADLDLRTNLGIGSGYQVFESERTNLSIEGGPAYVWEDFAGDEDNQYTAARWALRFDHYLLAKYKYQAFHHHSLNFGVPDTSNYLFKAETGLRVPIAESFSATAQVDFEYNNSPSEDAEHKDWRYLMKAGYNW